MAEIRSLAPSRIVVSPGPCTPTEAGISVELIRTLGPEVPTLGVCLGHQAIGEAFGGRTIRARRVMHGKTAPVRHEGAGVLAGLPSPFTVARYHSLVTDPAVLPPQLEAIAWTDLPTELAKARDASGSLRFDAGSIAIHAIGVPFVQRLTAERFGLPFHRAEKKVVCIDPRSGAAIEPKEPNAVKLEAFVFDALPLAESAIVLETLRVEEFAPIKNGTGVDSPATSHQLQSDRGGRWLAHHGVAVPTTWVIGGVPTLGVAVPVAGGVPMGVGVG